MYKKVTKPIARKLFNEGVDIYLLPCKVSETSLTGKGFIISPCIISKSEEGDNQFDRVVNYFEHYNCNNEMGYYAHYYIKE